MCLILESVPLIVHIFKQSVLFILICYSIIVKFIKILDFIYFFSFMPIITSNDLLSACDSDPTLI